MRLFVEEGVRSMLGLKPPIFFVSAYLAKKAKAAGPGLEADALLQASGFEELERYITDLLDEEGRVRLKLESPLGVVEELVRRYERAVDERVSLLDDDFKMSKNIESQLELYKEEDNRGGRVLARADRGIRSRAPPSSPGALPGVALAPQALLPDSLAEKHPNLPKEAPGACSCFAGSNAIWVHL